MHGINLQYCVAALKSCREKHRRPASILTVLEFTVTLARGPPMTIQTMHTPKLRGKGQSPLSAHGDQQ